MEIVAILEEQKLVALAQTTDIAVKSIRISYSRMENAEFLPLADGLMVKWATGDCIFRFESHEVLDVPDHL